MVTPAQSEIDIARFPALTDQVTRRVSSRVHESAGFDAPILEWLEKNLKIPVPAQSEIEEWEKLETEQLAEFRRILGNLTQPVDFAFLDTESGQLVVSVLAAILGGFRKTAEHYAQLKSDLSAASQALARSSEMRNQYARIKEQMTNYRAQ